jgi:hypothetical protein
MKNLSSNKIDTHASPFVPSFNNQLVGRMFQVELSAAVNIFLGEIDRLARYGEKSCHEHLEIQLPSGVLHWPSTAAFPDKCWGAVNFRLGTTGTEILGTIGLGEQSDMSELCVEEISRSVDEARTVYALKGIALSIEDMRSLLGYLLATFHAWSVNVSAKE